MIDLETFIALDKNGDEYDVVVKQISSKKPLSGNRVSKIFILKLTGEKIMPDNEEKVFYIPSLELYIADPRKIT